MPSPVDASQSVPEQPTEMIRSGPVTWESLQQALLESIKSAPDTIVISADGSETYLFAGWRRGFWDRRARAC